MTYRSGEFVAQYINDGDLEEEQIQPNGVDLTIGSIQKITSDAALTDDAYDQGNREEARIRKFGSKPNFNYDIGDVVGPYYKIDSLNPYVVKYAEVIEIPDNHIGFVYPRSRVMRSGAWLSTAVWDAGYRGKGEGGLLPFNNMVIEPDMRIAQIVFAETEELEQQYDGQHQGENL